MSGPLCLTVGPSILITLIAVPAVLGLSSHSNLHPTLPLPIIVRPSSLNLASPLSIVNVALTSLPCPSNSSMVLLLFLILSLKYVDGLALNLFLSL